MDTPLQDILAELRARFVALYGERLDRLVVYGSQARLQATSESDIDVLVVLHGPVVCGAEIARTEELVAALSLDHDVVIACVFVATEEFAQGRSPFLRNVQRQGVPV